MTLGLGRLPVSMITGVALTFGPTASVAQAPTAVWLERLAAACDAAAADPASLNAPVIPDSRGVVTADGKLAMWSGFVPELTEKGSPASMTITASTLPQGRLLACTLEVLNPTADAYTDLPALVAERAPDLLSAEPIALGGRWQGESIPEGSAMQWVAPGFPPPASLMVTMNPPVVTVALKRAIAAQ